MFEIHLVKTTLKWALWSFRVVTLPCYHGYNRYTYKWTNPLKGSLLNEPIKTKKTIPVAERGKTNVNKARLVSFWAVLIGRKTDRWFFLKPIILRSQCKYCKRPHGTQMKALSLEIFYTIILSKSVFFLLIGRKPITWPANNCLWSAHA